MFYRIDPWGRGWVGYIKLMNYSRDLKSIHILIMNVEKEVGLKTVWIPNGI